MNALRTLVLFRRRTMTSAVVFFTAFFSFCSAWAETGPSAQEEFIAKIIESHRLLAESFIVDTVVMEGTMQNVPDEPRTSIKGTFQRLGADCFSFHSIEDAKHESVSACNARYEFELAKDVGDGAWSVSDAKPLSRETTEVYACRAALNKFQSFLYVVDVPLAWLLSDASLYAIDDFHEEPLADGTSDAVLRITIVDPNIVYRDAKAVKYAAAIGFETLETKFNVEKYGYIPYELTFTQHGGSNKIVNGDFTEVLGTTIPVKTSSFITLEDGTSWNDIECVYRYEKAAELDQKYFTLANYGLPEPRFQDAHVTQTRYFVLIVGLGLLAIGAGRLYRRRRGQASA